MGMSAAHCQGNVREFQSVWRVVTLYRVRGRCGVQERRTPYWVQPRVPASFLDVWPTCLMLSDRLKMQQPLSTSRIHTWKFIKRRYRIIVYVGLYV